MHGSVTMAKPVPRLILVVVMLAACGTSVEAPDSAEAWSVDVVRFGPGEVVPATDLRVGIDLPSQGDMAADLLEPADVVVPGDVWIPVDAVEPVDVVIPPPDLVVLPDLQLPDMGMVDAGPCGECPAATPDCQNNQCVCNGQSCPGGFYCKGGSCTPCNSDLHCGAQCESCSSMGMYCQYDGSKCVSCDQNHPCPPGNKCINGECQTCEGMGLCGPDCIQCPPGAPLCVNGACECDGSSCGEGAMCVQGACVSCSDNDAAHCGPQCLVCQGGTPHCSGGSCTFCSTDEQCGPDCGACAEPTPYCRPDGSGCAGCLVDGDCEQGFKCKNFTCVENCKAMGCASDLGPTGKKCSTAYVVGRNEAMNTFQHSGDTYQDSNDDDLNYVFDFPECWDASYDNFFRIYLMPGDTITATVVPDDPLFNVMLKLYDGTECDDDNAGIFSANDKYKILCVNNGADNDPESFTWTADKTGWFTVVVDGRQSGEDEDWGLYDFSLKLTCAEANCCCG